MRAQPWPESAKQFVKQNAEHLSDKQIAETLTRLLGRHFSKRSVEHMRSEVLLIKKLEGDATVGKIDYSKTKPEALP